MITPTALILLRVGGIAYTVVALANEVCSPSETEIARACRVIVAMEQAQREGKGAVALDGKLIDIASIRQAEVMVKKAELIGGRT